MEIKIAESFSKSLDTLIMHEKWWYKVYAIFRYEIPRFVNNLINFKKALWNFRPWDYRYNMEIFMLSLKITEKNIRKDGLEIDTSRLKKCDSMLRAITILEHFYEDSFLELAESELGELAKTEFSFIKCEDKEGFSELVQDGSDEAKEHNSNVFKRSREIAEDEWKQLWKILEGQDMSKFNKDVDGSFEDWFDGTGLRSWWD